MTDPASTPSQSTTPLWIRLLLVVSLGLNLLVAGIVLGAVTGGRDGGGDRAGRDPGAAPFVRALEPGDRRAVLRQLRREGGARPAQSRTEMRARMDSLLEALRAETFDRARIEAVLEEQLTDSASRQALGQKVLLDHLEGMSREARSAYAARLEQALADVRPPRP